MGLKIYGVLRSRASRVVWLAYELSIAFEQVPVIQAYRLADPSAPEAPFNTASPSFRTVNPNGLVPTIDDDGFILHESLAITLYLSKKHGGPLAPRELREDALMTMWSLWGATECETNALTILRHRMALPENERDPNAAEAAVAALKGPFAVLDTALKEGGGQVVGGRFTVADINLAEIVRYAQPATELFEAAPQVRRWLEACQSRPAFKAMWEARNAEPA
jgi:glutathione S-transferase